MKNYHCAQDHLKIGKQSFQVKYLYKLGFQISEPINWIHHRAEVTSWKKENIV